MVDGPKGLLPGLIGFAILSGLAQLGYAALRSKPESSGAVKLPSAWFPVQRITPEQHKLYLISKINKIDEEIQSIDDELLSLEKQSTEPP
ncbi:hypothetical protein NEOLI_000594 [Neolecta irregularis DAH-3]|uniref:Uncharacterized protein n=1 Tax=Neolecta irregularis (strain DAH-3) TaxID=1198029 RepID=A0A1U7LR41_NEOID|nr:hypothetical protein NEOLI_000594 [Neolecta irregularis DAH-3]|eukprot:OLL25140.1 hypothetical protein NEOLI_000594 [Neolecta irregularis DAH-3]